MTKQYFKSPADAIIKDVCTNRTQRCTHISGIELLIDPFVFPSDYFRTTNFLLQYMKGISRGKRVCDMGCGAGIVGLTALYEGADCVVQVDINPYAVRNAKSNREYHGFEKSKLTIYESDCFSRVPFQLFDLIVFNIPFHSDNVEIQSPIERAFIDPNFESLKKFLEQSQNYLSKGGQIIITFSNKGDTYSLESLFSAHQYDWELSAVVNADQEYDNRLYSLTKRN